MTASMMQEKIRKMEAELKRLQSELDKINAVEPDRETLACLSEVYNG